MADKTEKASSSTTPSASGVGNIVGGIAGLFGPGNDAAGEAHNQLIIGRNIIDALNNAPDTDKPLILEQYRQAGILTPQLEQYVTAQVPALITTDPKLKQAQMQALKLMKERATGGLTAADRAALEQSNEAVQGDVTGRLGAIAQKMQEQGLTDSGTALAMKLSAAQNGANTEAANARDLAIKSQQARDNALGQLGSYSSQLQSTDFNQQSDQQKARSEMERFNVGNQINQQARNVWAQNQGQQFNINNAQNVANANVGQNNQESRDLLNRQRQKWADDVSLAQIKSGAHTGSVAPIYNIGQANAQAETDKISGAGKAVGTGAGLAAGLPAFNNGGVINAQKGGEVPGEAKVPGDSPENDIVHAILSPGEIVVPRTISESKFGKHLLKIIDAHNNLKKHMSGEDNG